jgi:hypothetical protein
VHPCFQRSVSPCYSSTRRRQGMSCQSQIPPM